MYFRGKIYGGSPDALGISDVPRFSSEIQIPEVPFFTNFPNTENPLSENNRWINNGAPANSFTKCRCTPGFAFGTNVGSGFDDSYDHLSGFTANYSVTVTLKVAGGLPNDGNSREIEIILRQNEDDSSGVKYYEVDAAYLGAITVVRLEGASGSFTVSGYNGNAPGAFSTGDKLRASVSGNVITVDYAPVSTGIFGNLGSVNVLTDTALANNGNKQNYTTGQPGIGFFIRPGANNTDFGISDCTVANI
jgi:hypothetical protein